MTDRHKNKPELGQPGPLQYDNRPEFLAGIRRFCLYATKAELAEIKKAIQKREAKLLPGGPSARGEIENLTARREEILALVPRRLRSKPAKVSKNTQEQLAMIESLIQSLAVEARKAVKKRGRPRAEEEPDWIAGTWAVMSAQDAQGWTWRQAAVASGLEPTKANIRTVQRRQKQLADIIRKGLRLPIERKF